MKSKWLISLFLLVSMNFPADAADQFEQLKGDYTSTENTFVTLKRLSFSRTKEGRIKVQGALVGFPDEVSIGEAIAEPCAPNRNKSATDTLLATFSSDKYKPFIVLTGISDKVVNFTCYMKDVDGTNVHFYGMLMKQQ